MPMCHTWSVKLLRYIELKTGHSDNGPAWIGYIVPSKSGRTLYFNGRGLMKLKGQRRGDSGGNYTDMETGESFWVSGVKKDRQDRHWAGSGKVMIEAAAVSDYLRSIDAAALDTSRCQVTNSIVRTDIQKLSALANASGKGWLNDPNAGRYSFAPEIDLSADRPQPDLSGQVDERATCLTSVPPRSHTASSTPPGPLTDAAARKSA
jgi:hypothetical protein